jgi:uncharacterized protein YndB with AHSA1/START domain
MTTPVSVDEDQIVQVRVHVDSTVSSVWQALTSPEGTAIWLGKGAVLRDKGQSYHCDDGSSGVVRSFHPLEQLRLSWHSVPDAAASLIEVDVTPETHGTRLRLWHDGLPEADRLTMRQRWQQRLDALIAGLPPLP